MLEIDKREAMEISHVCGSSSFQQWKFVASDREALVAGGSLLIVFTVIRVSGSV